MARYTKADAARHLGISRTTLYKLIQQGQVSPTPDGLIDDTELVRAAPVVDTLKERARTPTVTAPVDTNVSDDEHREQLVDSGSERSWTDVHARQRTSTDELVNELRAQVQDLREQRQVLRDDLRAAHENAALLLQMLQAERTRYDRLLDTPRPVSVPSPATLSFTESGAAPRGDMRRRIIALLQDHPEGLSPAQMRTHLGVDKRLAHTCLGMARDGLIRRVGPGRYGAG